MTSDIILIIAGCVLLLIGLVGGGITSQYGAVGKVDGNIPRTLCVIAGFCLIGIGVGLKIWPQSIRNDNPVAKPDPEIVGYQPRGAKTEPKSESVTFSIFEDPNSDNEQLDFMFDDQIHSRIVVSPVANITTVAVTVPSAGLHDYTIRGYTYHGDDRIDFAGNGQVDVLEGRQFYVDVDYNAHTAVLKKRSSSL
jgi:hypothetical protein